MNGSLQELIFVISSVVSDDLLLNNNLLTSVVYGKLHKIRYIKWSRSGTVLLKKNYFNNILKGPFLKHLMFRKLSHYIIIIINFC